MPSHRPQRPGPSREDGAVTYDLVRRAELYAEILAVLDRVLDEVHALAQDVEVGGQAPGLGKAGSKVGPVSPSAPASTFMPHNHPARVEGCFRCELSADEDVEAGEVAEAQTRETSSGQAGGTQPDAARTVAPASTIVPEGGSEVVSTHTSEKVVPEQRRVERGPEPTPSGTPPEWCPTCGFGVTLRSGESATLRTTAIWHDDGTIEQVPCPDSWHGGSAG